MKLIIKNPIIPARSHEMGVNDDYDLRAICVFAATGFFLDTDTYYKGLKILPAATILKEDGAQEKYFKWHYQPRNISLSAATDEFADLFETIIKEQTGNRKVILPLSGGLDSRTQAAALKRIGAKVHTYSYQFQNGYPEADISEKIAKAQVFSFQRMIVRPGYLWDCIDRLADINGCYSEFTHPRQMAFIDEYAAMGEVFSLGHWGDVLFDDMGVPDDLPFEKQVEVVLKKILKKGGLELARALWAEWGLDGSFDDYLRARVELLLKAIDISGSANARIRAFKSLYWAPRWTSVNLSVFESVRPVTLPYYDNRMCEFICTIPEKHLAGRQIQIEYLKRVAPQLARITWQKHSPFNLFNYRWNRSPYNLPFRLAGKLNRIISTQKYVQRNWELQFLGEENKNQFKNRIFEKSSGNLLPAKVVRQFWEAFWQKDQVYYSHPLSMLLTLSLFSSQMEKKNLSTVEIT